MRRQRIQKRVAIEAIVTLHADLEGAVGQRPRDTEQNVAFTQLAIVQSNLASLVHLAGDQSGRAGDAAAVLAAVGQVDACSRSV